MRLYPSLSIFVQNAINSSYSDVFIQNIKNAVHVQGTSVVNNILYREF